MKLKKLNPGWGGQKISDELAKVGYRACKRTVLKYLEIHGLNNPSLRKGLTWTEFIESHKFKIGIDFTSLISLMGHQLYIFVMIDLDRRSLISISVTYDPHFEWVKQQLKMLFLISIVIQLFAFVTMTKYSEVLSSKCLKITLD